MVRFPAFCLASFPIVGAILLSAAPPRTTSQPVRGLLLVANKGDRTIGIIDPVAGREIATIPDRGVTAHEVAASPDGRTAWAPIYGNSGVGAPGSDGRTLTIISVPDRRVIGSLDFGKGVRPHCAIFGPRDGRLYVTTELTDSITVIDPRTRRIVGTIPTGQKESHMLAITSDGRRGYTANVHAGTVSAIDLEGRKVLAVIPISKETQRISLSPDDRYAFTADQTQPRLAVIDTASNTLKTWIPLPAVAYGTAATHDGHWLIVTLPSIAQVAVVNLSTLRVVRTVDVVSAPQEVLVRPDDEVAYVSCDRSHKIAVIRTRDWKVEKFIEAGHGCDGLAWARE